MSREAMQIALDALEANLGNWAAKTKAVEVLRQALNTEQEPVAWASSLDFDDDDQEIIPVKDKGKLGTSNCDIPLYTAPKQWVGLTDEQVEDEWERITGHSIFGGDRSEGRAMYISPDEVFEFSRALEAAIKRKNT